MRRLDPGLTLAFIGALLAFPSRLSAADSIRIEKDVAYLGTDRKEKGDLYRPAQAAGGKRLPAVVIIHGGGWTGGDKGADREM